MNRRGATVRSSHDHTVSSGRLTTTNGTNNLNRSSNYKSIRRNKTTGQIVLLLGCGIALVAVYLTTVSFILRLHHGSKNLDEVLTSTKTLRTTPPPPTNDNNDNNNNDPCNATKAYQHWKDLTLSLAALPASEALKRLETDDPFGTRAFEQRLTAKETSLGRTLSLSEVQQLFPCPTKCHQRLTRLDKRNNHTLATRAFRQAQPGTFLFFQHLRKAGGTHFCSLAQANLPKSAVAKYYCMPDYEWSGWQGAGYLHHWNNSEISRRMSQNGHRIAGNEWDTFDVQHHFELDGAIFATSFRKPLDRALSQFRFECVENRGCKYKDVGKWWEHRTDLYNVYTLTFADPPKRFRLLKATYEDTTLAEEAEKRKELMATAFDTVLRFNLVLVMEWLAYAGPQVQQVLGFNDTSVLTQRVRPHLGQAKREDGQEKNQLGAAGITKASWDPKEYLTAEQYQTMSQLLTLDTLLTDVARRVFLERLVCGT